MRIYISGAITKDKGYYRKFMNSEIRLKKLGHEVVNPARLGKCLPKTFEQKDYLDVEKEIITKCDAICMLKGWEESEGAKEEYSFAKQMNIKVIFEKEVK